MTFVHLVQVGVVVWLLFGGGIEVVGHWFGHPWHPGDGGRRSLLMSFSVILFLRTTHTAFYLLKRKFGWEETFTVIFALFLYQVVYQVLGAKETEPLDFIDIGAALLFIVGSILNTASEMQRDKFKRDPANKGKLYTGGLFKLARHINYFGDSCWVLAWAIVTRDIWSMAMPLILTSSFLFAFIPLLTKYLRKRYGAEFVEWEKNSKKFFPFVY